MSLIRIVGSIAAVAFARGLGLVLALAVSVLLASRFGAGSSTDAFFFARRLTNGLTEALSRVVGMVLIPGLVSALRTKSVKDVAVIWRRQLFRIVSLSLLGAGLLALLAPYIVSALGPGLEQDRAELAVRLIRVLAFLIPAGLFLATSTSLLNAGRRFGVPALLTLAPKILLVCSLLLFVPPWGVDSLAWALLVGSIMAGLVLFIVLARVLPAMQRESAGNGTTSLQESTGRLWPSLLVHGYGQGTVWIDLAFASTVGLGGLSVLEYGSRMMTIFPGLLSSSLVAVMYTEYSHRSLDGSGGALQRSLVRTTRGGLFLLVPLIGLIALLGDDVVGLLLLRGAFDAAAADLTVAVMRFIAPAMVFAFLINNALSGVFADPAAPRLKMIGTAVAIALACRVLAILLLIEPLGVRGVALGSSIAALSMVVAMYPMLRSRWGNFLTRSDGRSMAGIALATCITLLLVYSLREWIGPAGDAGLMVRAMTLLGLGAAGIGCYIALATLLRLKEMSAARDLLLRRSARDPG